MSKQQIVDVFGEIQTEETCVNYSCRHGLSDHIDRYHGKCKCKTFKASGGKTRNERIYKALHILQSRNKNVERYREMDTLQS